MSGSIILTKASCTIWNIENFPVYFIEQVVTLLQPIEPRVLTAINVLLLDLTCVKAMTAMQLAAILALTGTPAPRANAHVPTMKLNVVRPCN